MSVPVFFWPIQYIIDHYSHFGVLQYLAKVSQPFISDGYNTYSRDQLVQREIAQLTGLGAKFVSCIRVRDVHTSHTERIR